MKVFWYLVALACVAAAFTRVLPLKFAPFLQHPQPKTFLALLAAAVVIVLITAMASQEQRASPSRR